MVYEKYNLIEFELKYSIYTMYFQFANYIVKLWSYSP